MDISKVMGISPIIRINNSDSRNLKNEKKDRKDQKGQKDKEFKVPVKPIR